MGVRKLSHHLAADCKQLAVVSSHQWVDNRTFCCCGHVLVSQVGSEYLVRQFVVGFVFAGVVFLLWTCCLVVCATMGYAHSKTNILAKVLPCTDEDDDGGSDIDHRLLIQKYRNLWVEKCSRNYFDVRNNSICWRLIGWVIVPTFTLWESDVPFRLFQLDEWVTWANDRLVRLFNLVKWKDSHLSFRL